MHFVIFDIDDTLIHSMEADGHYFAEAIELELDIRVDRNWRGYEHVSDAGIVAECAQRHLGRDITLKEYQRIKDRFLRLLEEGLRETPKAIGPMEGACELLAYIKAHENMACSLATGGWRQSAEIKLKHAGLWQKEMILKTSDDAVARVDIMQQAYEAIKTLGPLNSISYVGDGPWDVEATAALGWNFIGIGPRVRGVENWVKNFSNIDMFLNKLLK